VLDRGPSTPGGSHGVGQSACWRTSKLAWPLCLIKAISELWLCVISNIRILVLTFLPARGCVRRVCVCIAYRITLFLLTPIGLASPRFKYFECLILRLPRLRFPVVHRGRSVCPFVCDTRFRVSGCVPQSDRQMRERPRSCQAVVFKCFLALHLATALLMWPWDHETAGVYNTSWVSKLTSAPNRFFTTV
jgi:hypothetical protein